MNHLYHIYLDNLNNQKIKREVESLIHKYLQDECGLMVAMFSGMDFSRALENFRINPQLSSYRNDFIDIIDTNGGRIRSVQEIQADLEADQAQFEALCNRA